MRFAYRTAAVERHALETAVERLVLDTADFLQVEPRPCSYMYLCTCRIEKECVKYTSLKQIRVGIQLEVK